MAGARRLLHDVVSKALTGFRTASSDSASRVSINSRVAEKLYFKDLWSKVTDVRDFSSPSYHRSGSGVKRHGIAHVQATFTNTVVTVTDMDGNTKSWASAGSVGFKGCKRKGRFAAQAAAEQVARQAVQQGYSSVEVRLKGVLVGGKESSVRGLQIGGLGITRIRDVTPIPHNGCRAPKKRRV